MPDALARLALDGIVQREGTRVRTTRRWQGAMARAAYQLQSAASDESFDLRVPIAMALVELYGRDHPDDEIVAYVAALLPLECAPPLTPS